MNKIKVTDLKCRINILNEKRQGFILEWNSNQGFGELYFRKDEHGNFYCDSETLPKEKIMKILEAFVDQCEIRDYSKGEKQ